MITIMDELIPGYMRIHHTGNQHVQLAFHSLDIFMVLCGIFPHDHQRLPVLYIL